MEYINSKGMEYLRTWIIATTRSDEFGPYHSPDARNLDAWATEAEESLAAGNGAHVEMNEIATRSGRTETFIVPADGIRSDE